MQRLAVAAMFAALAFTPVASDASKSSSHLSSASPSHSAGHSKATGVPRDSHGKIARSEKSKEALLNFKWVAGHEG